MITVVFYMGSKAGGSRGISEPGASGPTGGGDQPLPVG